MASKTRKMMLLGQEMTVTEVDIVARPREHVAEYHLEDGSVIKFTAVPTAVLRLEGQWSPDGSPMYLVLNGTIVTVLESPPELHRKP